MIAASVIKTWAGAIIYINNRKPTRSPVKSSSANVPLVFSAFPPSPSKVRPGGWVRRPGFGGEGARPQAYAHHRPGPARVFPLKPHAPDPVARPCSTTTHLSHPEVPQRRKEKRSGDAHPLNQHITLNRTRCHGPKRPGYNLGLCCLPPVRDLAADGLPPP